jgi:hypothetical protein
MVDMPPWGRGIVQKVSKFRKKGSQRRKVERRVTRVMMRKLGR